MDPQFVVDTSVVTRLHRPAVALRLAELGKRRVVAVTSMTMLEVGFSARSAAEFDALLGRIAVIEPVDVASSDFHRALAVQRELASIGHRGRAVPDLLIAAAADRLNLCVLHYDRDFELIAGVTGQPHEWVVKPGSID